MLDEKKTVAEDVDLESLEEVAGGKQQETNCPVCGKQVNELWFVTTYCKWVCIDCFNRDREQLFEPFNPAQ